MRTIECRTECKLIGRMPFHGNFLFFFLAISTFDGMKGKFLVRQCNKCHFEVFWRNVTAYTLTMRQNITVSCELICVSMYTSYLTMWRCDVSILKLRVHRIAADSTNSNGKFIALKNCRSCLLSPPPHFFFPVFWKFYRIEMPAWLSVCATSNMAYHMHKIEVAVSCTKRVKCSLEPLHSHIGTASNGQNSATH